MFSTTTALCDNHWIQLSRWTHLHVTRWILRQIGTGLKREEMSKRYFSKYGTKERKITCCILHHVFMKWVCDHRRESQFKQLRKLPEKKIFGASTGFQPVASALALQCSPSWAMKTHTLEAGQFIDHCDGHILISFVFPQFTAFHSVYHVFMLLFGVQLNFA